METRTSGSAGGHGKRTQGNLGTAPVSDPTVAFWGHHGPTEINNLVMLCRSHHRQVHHTEWLVRIRDGLPEFVPPKWIDPDQVPRRKVHPLLAA